MRLEPRKEHRIRDWGRIHLFLVGAARDPVARLRLALIIGFGLLVFGTTGYILIEHFSPLDALFMTVITLATVGYDEVGGLHTPGKIFTIVLIVLGIGTATWVLTTFVEVFVSEQALKRSERSRMDQVIAGLKNHYIVCGYGRIGQQIVQGYNQNNVPVVVLEQDPIRSARMLSDGVLCIEGDGADDDVLTQAGIERARCLIAVTPSDAVNTFVVLSARGLRPDLFIVARCDVPQNEAKLTRAGANRVVSTHVLGGRWMAALGVNPAVTDFILAIVDADHARFQLREVTLGATSSFIGSTFGAANFRGKTGALVVAIRRADKEALYMPNPPDDTVLAEGDTLILIGSPTQVQRIAIMVNPGHPMEPLVSEKV